MDKNRATRTALEEGRRIANCIIRRANGHLPHIKDYPAAIVGCGIKNQTDIVVDYSRGCQNYEYYPPVLCSLLNLGEIGNRGRLCENRIGSCAEPHAANKFIKNHNNLNIEISDFEFGEAIRPRTSQVIPYCNNCKETFPNLR